jgi:hypothetical protein
MFDRTIAGLGLTFSVAAALTGPRVLGANVLANPDFELPDASAGDMAGITGWTEFGAPNTRFVTRGTPPHGGAQCLKMFGPFDVPFGGTGMFQDFPATPGQTWVAQIWSLNFSSDPMNAGGNPASPSNFCAMKIEFRQADGNLVGGVPLAGVNVFEAIVCNRDSPLDVWQLHGLGSAPAPDGTTTARFLVVEVQMHQGTPADPFAGGSVFLDDAFFDLACGLHDPVFDVNDDAKVDNTDFTAFTGCVTRAAVPLPANPDPLCICMDRDEDSDVDMDDFAVFQRCYTGAAGTLNPGCDDG